MFGLINISIALILIYTFPTEIKKSGLLKIKAFLGFVIIVIVFIYSNRLLSFSEENLYGEKIVYAKTTPYQRIVLTNNKKEFKLYLNNNLQFSSFDEYRYHEALVHPIMSLSKSVSNVLILGGGDGLAVREILKYTEVKNITLVDLDADMTKLFMTNTILTRLNSNSLTNSRVKVINQDAFMWLKNNDKEYDLVIVDFPDPSNYSVGKLYTKYFFTKLKSSLKPEALAVIQTTSPYFAPKSFWCINKTVNQVFPFVNSYHCYVPSFGEWGYVLASNHSLSFSQPIQRRIDGLRFYDYNLQKLSSFTKDMKTDNVEVNELNNQILVRYFEEEWGKL
jgi:spermidine synthase